MLQIITTYRLAERGACHILRLMGRLGDTWVQERRRSWPHLRDAVAGVPIHVDPAGRVMLAEMRRAGVGSLAGKGLGAPMRDDCVSAERRTKHATT
jgi:hypothetical protein